MIEKTVFFGLVGIIALLFGVLAGRAATEPKVDNRPAESGLLLEGENLEVDGMGGGSAATGDLLQSPGAVDQGEDSDQSIFQSTQNSSENNSNQIQGSGLGF